MLLLVTVALVLAGLGLLILGFVRDSVTDIYASIACAAVAGVALVVFNRLSRRRYPAPVALRPLEPAPAP